MTTPPKVLIANRGEIAIRICRAATELGWQTVALYTEKDASHAYYADEAILLDSPTKYMDPEHIADIARRTGCTHVHPGYGFLSESPKFASLFRQGPSSPITFIGPSVETLKIASDKMLSRELAVSLDVSVAPGARVSSVEDVHQFVTHLGHIAYPIVIKALDGGGGRGIRIVNNATEVADAYKRCLNESPSKQIFVEKALVGPGWKHIEVQIVGDGQGNVAHLWERECSVQRRFQKIVEMAPSTLPRVAAEPLLEAALKMARHLQYAGLGTFEFLVNSRSHEWVFLEINPRIQVEHTVTEEIMGIDLVRVQILLSTSGTSLATVLPQHTRAPPPGYAIQLRIVAEDPHKDFRLSPGEIAPHEVSWPSGNGTRVDTWVSAGPYAPDGLRWTVGVDFDSLLAKVIVHGSMFEEATAKALRAVREVRVSGEVKTNRDILAGIVSHTDWQSGSVHTRWLEEHLTEIIHLGETKFQKRRDPLASSATANTSPGTSLKDTTGVTGTILLQPGSSFQLSISPAGESASSPQPVAQKHNVVLSTIGHNAFPDQLSGTLATSLSPTPLAFSLIQLSSISTSSQVEFANAQDPTHLSCPLAGKIVELHPALSSASGGFIRAGEPLIVVTVMKMESVVNAPVSGKVSRLGKGIEVGAVIPEGSLVCVLDVQSAGGMAKL
ncbi:carboxylase:pyruvate/acetyl-coa/propionyl-CoA [Lentinus tigrinus ALCF2SS1-7]|uniref:Carboxylase:pyruvate/acetyl-coa/propionyl-CoA n=1 Tax=Lentinus tigrinus ALCF2SS1-6 TaxID=1328759 RepID=A0A5C2S0Y1_9APHY|nr:carboxylase:pyruvate/acetyl-coa/propionyl-CoA [Lentinus tigrinus ALCF2SS1-6]RPD71700.1 carboxylase:pyruvate/acetyl-coa/propionyl-CoA [Lentinus tigrinus ALCF2SS1-7]